MYPKLLTMKNTQPVHDVHNFNPILLKQYKAQEPDLNISLLVM